MSISQKITVLMFLIGLIVFPVYAQKKNSSRSKKKVKEPPAFVYGSIVGVQGLRHVYIQKLGKVYVGRINRPQTEPLKTGAFYFDKVEPGQYYLAGFSIKGGETFWIPYTKASVKEVLFDVLSEKVHFMGSYQVQNIKAGKAGRTGSFEINKVDQPVEKKLLREVHGHLEDSPWQIKTALLLKN